MGPHPTPASLSICRRVKQAGTIRVPPPPPPTSPPTSRPLWGCCVSGQRWNKPQARYFTISDRPVSNHFLPNHLCKDRAPFLSLRSFGPSLNCVFTFHLLLTLSWAWNDEFLIWIASTVNWSLMTRKLRGMTDCHTMNETGHFFTLHTGSLNATWYLSTDWKDPKETNWPFAVKCPVLPETVSPNHSHWISFFTSVVQTPKSKSEWLMVDEERCAEQVRPRLCFSNTLCVTPHCLLSHPIPVHFHCLKFYRLLLVTPLSCTPVRAWERLASYHFSVCVLFRRRIKQNNRCLDILIF